jgi:hypothetical protein
MVAKIYTAGFDAFSCGEIQFSARSHLFPAVPYRAKPRFVLEDFCLRVTLKKAVLNLKLIHYQHCLTQ